MGCKLNYDLIYKSLISTKRKLHRKRRFSHEENESI